MFMEERQQEVANYINEHGKITITQMVEMYDISAESARRDLRMLEQKGLCNRTHGGAIKLTQVRVMPPQNQKYEKMNIQDNYRKIAMEAAKNIQENEVVYLTGGSLGYIMLEYLPKNISYTLVVNSVDVAYKLREFDNIEVYMVGGKMRRMGNIVDSFATDFVKQLHFDVCFLTGGGANVEFGLSNDTEETAVLQRAVIENTRKKILLMPSKKIGVNAFIKVCEMNQFHMLITDWECAEEQITKFEENGIDVMVVEQ